MPLRATVCTEVIRLGVVCLWYVFGLRLPDHFFALDVETANADRASICQIGIVEVSSDKLVNPWTTLIDPEGWFDPFNSSIHGINSAAVRGAPTFPEVHKRLIEDLNHRIVVSHTAFDRTAISRAVERYELFPPSIRWLDSARIVRRAWPDKYGERGYGLQNVASDLGIQYRPHDALEDARAAAEVVVRACATTGRGIEDWCRLLLRHPKTARRTGLAGPIRQVGNPEGQLYGEVVVFTGRLEVSRHEAAVQAAEAGCCVQTAVTRKTTILVVGLQDRNLLRGYDKSSKHRKAEDLIRRGANLRILSERDFNSSLLAHD